MEDKNKKLLSRLKIILIIILILSAIWFGLTIYEFYRVKSERRPIICMHEVKDVESNSEYSRTCYGILYKYREYYMNDDDSLSAREFTLFFKEFKRVVAEYEIR